MRQMGPGFLTRPETGSTADRVDGHDFNWLPCTTWEALGPRAIDFDRQTTLATLLRLCRRLCLTEFRVTEFRVAHFRFRFPVDVQIARC